MRTLAQADTGDRARLREFVFTEEDFQALRRLVRELTGISLAEQKRELVYGRLSRRLRALQLQTFQQYRELLARDDEEIAQFCNAITTNLTAFFREPYHFEYLRNVVLASLVRHPPSARRLRIWSAGCSSGEEPYSIAMTLLEALPDLAGWDIRILATDIDSEVLERAKRGVYPADRVAAIGRERLARFFREHRAANGIRYEVAPELSRLITFKPLNLIGPWPMKGPLDIVFCRNVVIYFDKDTQRELFGRMAALQRPGDLLFLGHSESLFKVSDAYTLIGRTIYRRTDATQGEPQS